MNRFDRAMEQLKSRLKVDAKVTITYTRGEEDIPITTAWFGRQLFRVMDQGNARVEWSDRDFMIPVEDLVFNNVRVTPQRGDWILVTTVDPTGEERYEVAAPEGEKPWRFCDPQNRLYRVHTKRMVS